MASSICHWALPYFRGLLEIKLIVGLSYYCHALIKLNLGASLVCLWNHKAHHNGNAVQPFAEELCFLILKEEA